MKNLIQRIFLTSIIAGANAMQCFNSTNSTQCQSVEISCPSDYVIYKPNIQASTGLCGDTDMCYDTTVDMIIATANCYWKQSCTVPLPTTPLIKCDQQVAKSFSVFDWQCLHRSPRTNEYYGYICDETLEIGPEASQGFIRSHPNIPWIYDEMTIPETFLKPGNNTNLVPKCRKTIHLRPKERVLVTVDFNHIDHENDQLTIRGKATKKESETHLYDAANGKIDIIFTKPHTSKGGPGFAICFKKLQENEQYTETTSACDRMITKANFPVKNIDLDIAQCKRVFQSLPFQNGVDDEDVCKNVLQFNNEPTKQASLEQNQPATTVATPPQVQDFCTKCLSRKRPGKKCKRKCCKTGSKAKACRPRKRNKCPKQQKLTNLCTKCEIETKCRKTFKRQCSKCCKGNLQILKNCKTRKRGKGRRKKGRKNRRN